MTDWLRRRATRTRRFGSVCSGAFFLAAAGPPRRQTSHDTLGSRRPTCRKIPVSHRGQGRDLRHRRQASHGCRRHCGARSRARSRRGGSRARDGDEGCEPAGHVLQAPGRTDAVQPQGRDRPRWPCRTAGTTALGCRQSWTGPQRREPRGAHGHQPASLCAAIPCRSRNHPATWVEEARVNAARRLLELGNEAPKQVALHCGFADADTLRRAFARHVGVTPAEYRKRFARIPA